MHSPVEMFITIAKPVLWLIKLTALQEQKIWAWRSTKDRYFGGQYNTMIYIDIDIQYWRYIDASLEHTAVRGPPINRNRQNLPESPSTVSPICLLYSVGMYWQKWQIWQSLDFLAFLTLHWFVSNRCCTKT